MDAFVTLKLAVQELYTVKNALMYYEEQCRNQAKACSPGQEKHELMGESMKAENLLGKLR